MDCEAPTGAFQFDRVTCGASVLRSARLQLDNLSFLALVFIQEVWLADVLKDNVRTEFMHVHSSL